MNVDLTDSEAQYLSVLAALDMGTDRARGITPRPWHHTAWEKLQPACQWEDDTEQDDSP